MEAIPADLSDRVLLRLLGAALRGGNLQLFLGSAKDKGAGLLGL